MGLFGTGMVGKWRQSGWQSVLRVPALISDRTRDTQSSAVSQEHIHSLMPRAGHWWENFQVNIPLPIMLSPRFISTVPLSLFPLSLIKQLSLKEWPPSKDSRKHEQTSTQNKKNTENIFSLKQEIKLYIGLKRNVKKGEKKIRKKWSWQKQT